MGLFSSKGPNSEILKEKHFSITLNCVMPMLGQARAEFQIYQPDTILCNFDFDQWCSEIGMSHLKKEVPYKSIHYVYNRTKKQTAMYAIVRSTGKIVTSDFEAGEQLQAAAPATLWLPDLFDLIEGFPKAVETDLVNDEATLGDKKLSFVKDESLTFNYIKKGDTLTGISQNRPTSFGLLSFVNAFVVAGKILSDQEMVKIPENLVFEQR